MQLCKLNREHLTYIIDRMKADDRREIFATRFDESTEGLVEDCLRCGPFSWIAAKDGEPITAIGAAPLWPGVWSVWMFSTDNLYKIGFSLTKFSKRIIIPSLKELGAHRVECRSIEGHTVAQKWLKNFGAEIESKMIGYGKNKENFYTFSMEL